jgi:hypothetical protein
MERATNNKTIIYQYRFTDSEIKRQSDRPPKISTSIQFSSSAIEIENNIGIHRTFPTKPKDDAQNE